MNAQSEKTEQTRRESLAKEAEDEKEKNQDGCFYEKSQWEKKGFSTGSDGLGRFKKNDAD